MARLVTVTFESKTGMPEDRYVNTFAFTGGVQATTAELQAMTFAVTELYNTAAPGNGSALGAHLSSEINRSVNHTLRVYDIDGALDGSPHGSPIYEETFGLTPSPSDTRDLPAEVSIAVTLEAIGRETAAVETPDGSDIGPEPDRPKQRHTGRIYFGPLTANVLPARAAGVPTRPLAGIPELFRDAVAHLAGQTFPVVVGVAMQLGVWSRADARVTALESVSVDNAFDTQRRRGVEPSQRLRVTV